MFDALLAGLIHVLQWPSPLYLVIGIFIGLLVGALPGLGGLTALAILLPLSFTMEPVPAFALLLGVYAVVTTGEALTSILLGIPGGASTAATILDGYPMALRGDGARALGASFTSSGIGGVLGACVLALSVPIAKPLVLAFASPEFFMLALLGLTMVGTLSGRSLPKGLSAAALGAMLSTVGYSPDGAVPRFTFGALYLYGGIALVPLVLGYFSLPELLQLSVLDRSISGGKRRELGGSVMDGVKDALKHKWLIFRATALGVYVGFLPGIGGSVADWLAYGHAIQSAKVKDQFGKGDVRGVIAAESSANAVRAGDMIPTVAFGIPGSASMAILLGAFVVQGIQPGPTMITANLDFTFSLVWMLAIANILGTALLLIWARPAAIVTDIPPHILIAVLVPIIFMAAWIENTTMGDWIALLVFGLLGHVMRQGDWPRAPLILGYLLGKIMEEELGLSNSIYGWHWIYRPWVLMFVVLILAAVAYSVRQAMLDRRRGADRHGETGAAVAERTRHAYSAALAGILLLGFAACALWSLHWSLPVGRFPFVAGTAGAVVAALVVVSDLRALRRLPAGGPEAAASRRHDAKREFGFLAWLCAIPLATLFVGQLLAFALFILSYMRFARALRLEMVRALCRLRAAGPLRGVRAAAAGRLVRLADRSDHLGHLQTLMRGRRLMCA